MITSRRAHGLIRKAVAVCIATAFFITTPSLPGYSAGTNLRPQAAKQSSNRLADLGKDLVHGSPRARIVNPRALSNLMFNWDVYPFRVERNDASGWDNAEKKAKAAIESMYADVSAIVPEDVMLLKKLTDVTDVRLWQDDFGRWEERETGFQSIQEAALASLRSLAAAGLVKRANVLRPDQITFSELVEDFIAQQVSVKIAKQFINDPSNELAVRYDAMDRGPFLVQINPYRAPEFRSVVAEGKAGLCFLCKENQHPDEREIVLNKDWNIYPNPNPYEKNHFVLAKKEREDYHPYQVIQSVDEIDIALDTLERLAIQSGNRDYSVTFNGIGAAASSPHFHYQGFDYRLPLTSVPVDYLMKNPTVSVGRTRSDARSFPVSTYYIEARNKIAARQALWNLLSSIRNKAMTNGINILYTVDPRENIYKINVIMRKAEIPGAGVGGLENVKMGICEVSGMAIVYSQDMASNITQDNFIEALKRTVVYSDDVQKQWLESMGPMKDGGDIQKKTIVAVVGGTGNIGKPVVNRLKEKGNLEVVIGSRNADPARGIMRNEDAVAIADVVIVTVPVDAFFGQVETLAPLMKPGATFLSMGVAINKAQKELLGANYRSVAEKVNDIIRQKAPGRNISVVAAMHNVPGEWHADPRLRLTQDIIVLSDDRDRADLVAERVVRQISSLNPVYCGGLENSCYAEALTPAIIRTDKELLRGRSLKELYDFVASRNGRAEVADLQQYNREVLDKELVTTYAKPEVLDYDLKALASRDVSVRQKEYVAIGLSRYLQIIPRGTGVAQRIQGVLDRYNAPILDHKVYESSEKDFDGVLKTLPSIKDARGAIVIGGNVILENAGAMAAIKNIRSVQPGITVVVWAADDKVADSLRTIGVEDSVGVIAVARLHDVLNRVRKDVSSPDKIMLINAERDLDAIKAEFRVDDADAFIRGKLSVNSVTLRQPEPGQTRVINDMALVFSRALAAIFRNETELRNAYGAMIRNYHEKKKLSQDNMAVLNDLSAALNGMPLVTVSDKVAVQQAAYREAVTRI